MQALKRRLKGLHITYRDLAKRAGQKTSTVSLYLGETQPLGPGPEWVERTLREALLEGGVPIVEVNELIGSWKEARITLNRGAEMADALTLEQQIGELVESAWSLRIDAEADKMALKGAIRRGLGIDEETRRRGGQKLFEDELANESAVELRAELWAQREQSLLDRKADAEARRKDLQARALALTAAMAGAGDDNLLLECKELGVDPADRLKALEKDAIPAAVKDLQEAVQALKVLPQQPLHPENGRTNMANEIRFAQDSLDRAALILSKPWTVAEEQPELALHIFALRSEIAPVPDMADHLRKAMRFDAFPKEARYWFCAGLWRGAEDTVARPAIWWSSRRPESTVVQPQFTTSPLLFIAKD